MPFTFKLSQRLARLWAMCVAAALACEPPAAAGPASPAQVTQILVVPDSVTLDPAQQVQFAAYGRGPTGDSVSAAVAWNATGGAIALNGMYTADTAVGDFQVTATSTLSHVSGSSRVHVRRAGGGGGTILFQETFENNAFAGRGWYDNTAMAITNAEHVVGSASALEIHFTPSATTPTWGGAARHLFPATVTLYVSYWVKYSANWVGSGRPYHPHEFMVMSDLDGDYDGPSNAWLNAYLEDNYQNGGIPRMALQDSKAINTSYGTPPINLIGTTENRSTGGCNGVVETNVETSCFSFPPWFNDKAIKASQVGFQPNPGPDYKGNWNHVETYYQLNSVVGGIGQADGVMQYWLNATLVIDRHDILYRTGARPAIRFHQFLIAPYIGDGSPADQFMWVDNLTVATAKP